MRTRKIEPTIPAEAYARLERLVRVGVYGSTASEVARYLLIRSLDDLMRAGMLPDDDGKDQVVKEQLPGEGDKP